MLKSNIVINVLSWNCASNIPGPIVDSVLTNATHNHPDLISISLEEIAPTKETQEQGNSKYFGLWVDKITSVFAPLKYSPIEMNNYGGVALFVLKYESTNIEITNLNTKHFFYGGIKTLNNYILPPNKASIKTTATIKLNKQERVVSFIGNHLQAYDEEYLQRNKMWLEVDESTLADDYVIFQGDLNYRVDDSFENVIEKIKNNQIQEILEKDQLKRAQKENSQLQLYDEAEISFNPTYKYDENSDVYDTSSKHRVPSYTDRILVKTQNKCVKPVFLNYYRLENMFSDHRPVILSLDISFDV